MNSDKEQKEVVKQKYEEIATGSGGCCGAETSSCCGTDTISYSMIGDDYNNVDGHVADADLGLGCGLPTEHAGIKKGDIVVDLGSGAGNDVFVARNLAGETGTVIGIDMTEAMIDKAQRNKEKLGYKNVEFKMGDIDDIPLPADSTDVVISNCVLNLVPDKKRAYKEIYRILKPGARFCISDIVVEGELPEEFKKSAELYAGCVSGAIEREKYLEIINDTGFEKIEIKKSRKIELPADLISKHLDEETASDFIKSGSGIFSITITAEKPAKK